MRHLWNEFYRFVAFRFFLYDMTFILKGKVDKDLILLIHFLPPSFFLSLCQKPKSSSPPLPRLLPYIRKTQTLLPPPYNPPSPLAGKGLRVKPFLFPSYLLSFLFLPFFPPPSLLPYLLSFSLKKREQKGFLPSFALPVIPHHSQNRYISHISRYDT